MARIDFLYGVMFLITIQLSPLFFYAFGYLDAQRYLHVYHNDAFYEHSAEHVLEYMDYKIILFLLCEIVALLFVNCNTSMGRVSRLQIQCYRPIHFVPCIVSLYIHFIRYTNITAMLTDDIMAQVQWKQCFIAVSSCFWFSVSFLLSVFRNVKFPLVKLLIKIIRLLSFIFAFCLVLHMHVDFYFQFLNIMKKIDREGEFLTTWSFHDHEFLYNDFTVSEVNTHERTFRLDQDLFHRTGQKLYRTTSSLRYQSEDKYEYPYQQASYKAGIGESVSLHCRVASKTRHPTSELYWSLNGRPLRSNCTFCKITTNNKTVDHGYHIYSQLDINFIENNGFGNFTCSLLTYEYAEVKLNFRHKKPAPFIKNIETVIARYNWKKYSGREIYIYAALGSVIDIKWKLMSFDYDNEDLIQYYYVNGVPFDRLSTSWSSCTAFSYIYMLYGEAMKWFSVWNNLRCTHSFKQIKNFVETRFTECAGSNAYGVHTVEYFRRVYDKNSQSFVLREVKHPDTIYVLPDTPYFLKTDNETKTKHKEVIQHLSKSASYYPWFETSHAFVLICRAGIELIIFIILLLLPWYSLGKFWKMAKLPWPKILKCILRKLAEALNVTDRRSTPRTNFLYSCYIICGNTDRNIVYNQLVVPLKQENITTSFNQEESIINRSGKSVFDIFRDILTQCEHLIFYVTSSYLNEECTFNDDLDNVLLCIKEGYIPPYKVLIIIADGCGYPDKLIFNLPQATAKVHDWVKVTESSERIRQIIKWINEEKYPKTSEVVVSTAILR